MATEAGPAAVSLPQNPPEPDWLVPDWPAPAHVRAVCTTRQGGVSLPPFDAFNLGDHVGDDPRHVAANRAALAHRLGAQPVFLQQVHGVEVVALDRLDGGATVPVADACLTAQTGQACVVMVADCLPVLVTDRRGRWVAAAHAGWRGLAGAAPGVSAPAGWGVLEALIAALTQRAADEGARVDAADWLVWLGPCIGPQAFEVGPEVRAAFVSADDAATACFVPQAHGKHLADLPALARRRLAALGIGDVYGNNGSTAWCTVSQPSRFFSHRRDAARLGSTGRLAACIWRV